MKPQTYGGNRGKRPCLLPKSVGVPIELYKSLQGVYFIGYADELSFGRDKSAWARLYNPPGSGVILFVNVWTVTDISTTPYRAQFWFNAEVPGEYTESPLVTSSNTAIRPLPAPAVRLELASEVEGEPSGGVKAFVRRAQPQSTLVETESGKLIFPPGGSFLVFLSKPEYPDEKAGGRVAFGWWEENLQAYCVD